jgi:hypothetical protein
VPFSQTALDPSRRQRRSWPSFDPGWQLEKRVARRRQMGCIAPASFAHTHTRTPRCRQWHDVILTPGQLNQPIERPGSKVGGAPEQMDCIAPASFTHTPTRTPNQLNQAHRETNFFVLTSAHVSGWESSSLDGGGHPCAWRDELPTAIHAIFIRTWISLLSFRARCRPWL